MSRLAPPDLVPNRGWQGARVLVEAGHTILVMRACMVLGGDGRHGGDSEAAGGFGKGMDSRICNSPSRGWARLVLY